MLSLREREFVEAARSLGASDRRIMFVDILPNILAPVIVYASLLIPVVIVVEATLSFLGLGLAPPTADWGGMISDAQNYYTTAWWFIVFPGAALLLTTLAFNLFGDGVRDAFDPRSDRLWPSEGCTMLRFLVRRIALGLLVMWLISLAVFALFFVAPNNVARTLAGRQATPETVALISHRLGPRPADLEAVPRLRRQGAARRPRLRLLPPGAGDARSWRRRCRSRSPSSSAAAIIWLVLGVFNGVVSAIRPRSFTDRGLTVFSPLLLLDADVPARTAAALLPLLPAHCGHHDLPGRRLRPAHRRARSLGAAPHPAVAHPRPRLGRDVHPPHPRPRCSTSSARTTSARRGPRASARGGSIVRHALRAALTPVVTQFGIDVGALLGGAVVTETVFSLPGLGKTAIDAINQQDLPVIIGIVLFASAAVVVGQHRRRRRSTPCSTPACGCTDQSPCGRGCAGPSVPMRACQDGEVHPSPAPCPCIGRS